MIWDFSGRKALVTGGASGIGEVIARMLSSAGAEVHVFDRIVPVIPTGRFYQVDIGSSESIGHAVKALPEGISLLVNNAGITRDRSIVKMSDDEWQSVIDINLGGAFYLIRALAPAMHKVGAGSIVNITSINGIRGKFGQANYSAAKAGLIGLTKTAARELGPKGIRVNAVAPGMVLTEMSRKLPPEILERALAETVLKKLATPEDIADTVLFLLSEKSKMITGEVIKVDSGQYI